MRFEIDDRPVLSDLLSDLMGVCNTNALIDRVLAIDEFTLQSEKELTALRSYREKILSRVTELNCAPVGE